jgi:hypothetical protein
MPDVVVSLFRVPRRKTRARTQSCAYGVVLEATGRRGRPRLWCVDCRPPRDRHRPRPMVVR